MPQQETRNLVEPLATGHSNLLPSTLVEHLCYKCQASIDETLPFCPHCGAPQIRVAGPDNDLSQTLSPETPPVVLPSGAPVPSVFTPQVIQWDAAWKGALLSGLIAAVLSAAPIISLGCCLWMLGCGALAVFLYQRRVPGAFVTSGMGMRIGAVSGMVAFLVNAVWMTFRFTRDVREGMALYTDRHSAPAGSTLSTDEALSTDETLSTDEALSTDESPTYEPKDGH